MRTNFLRSLFSTAMLCGVMAIVHANATGFDSSDNTGRTLRIGSKSDLLSLDPHKLSESLQLDVLGNVYEPLVGQSASKQLTPILAQSWQQRSPTVWRFKLRDGVRFNHGETFSADDVVYSFDRARNPKSGIQVFVGTIKQVKIIDRLTVEFVLNRPKEDFPRSLGFWYMMSSKWCKSDACEFDNKASPLLSQTNGTGPYRLISRTPGHSTTFAVNPTHWARTLPSLRHVEFTVINDDAKRAALLLKQDLDIALPYPLDFIEEAKHTTKVEIAKQAEARVLYLGFDLSSAELNVQNQRVPNPLRDLRVRRAIQLGIDHQRLHDETMSGFSHKLAILIPQGTVGYEPKLDMTPARNLVAARSLLAEAGYANGFKIELDCSNDRYLNDAAICQAISRDLAEIGIEVSLTVRPKAEFFPKVFAKKSHFYLLGAATNSGDGMNIVYPVLGSENSDGRGELNFGGYANQELDKLLEQLSGEDNKTKRERIFKRILEIQRNELPQIPLHQQILPTGFKASLSLTITAENGVPWREVRLKN